VSSVIRMMLGGGVAAASALAARHTTHNQCRITPNANTSLF
jgi:hypothetical protein